MTYKAGGHPVVCRQCGSDSLDEKFWHGTGAGMALADPGGMFTKRNDKSIRFLVCARCGSVACFDPAAETPLSKQ